MKKKLVLEFETGLPPKYKKWAKEAAENFVSLFPEYKDSLTVDIDGTPTHISRNELENIISRSTQASPQAIRNLFEEQPDGTFLRKDSLDWHIKNSKVSDAVDLGKILDAKTQKHAVPEKQSVYYTGGPLLISVCNQKGCGKSGGHYVFGARGMSNSIGGPCIAVKTCEDVCRGYSERELEAYFKDIIIHELGHSFNATHEERKNCVENLGAHCTDPACLMYEYAYTSTSFNRRQTENNDNPFCRDCMEAMHDYMQNTLKLERTNDNQQNMSGFDISHEQAFLSGLSDEEKAFLKDYLDYLRNSGIRRSPEDLLWDRVYLLEKFHSRSKNSNTATDILKQEFESITKNFDWSKEEYKSKISSQNRKQLEIRTSAAQPEITITDKPLIQTAETSHDPLYKVQLRGILYDSAKHENLDYRETYQKNGFLAEITTPEGTSTRFQATNAQELSIVSQNAQGEKVTPPFRRFMDIVSYAQLRHSSVTFGKIESPEFKAQLMVACLYAEPPVRMKGAPRIDNEFLSQLSPQTAKTLHSAYYGKRIKNEKESYKGLKRSQAERYLELNEKARELKPREWAELFYHKDQLVGAIAMKDAQRRFQSLRPREAEWEQRTGFKPETLRHYENKRPGDASWKLHLDVTPNPNEPTTKALRQYLEKLDIDYKVCGGEENGKGITAYVGSYQDCFDLSIRLQMEFGNKVKLPAQYTDQFTQETEFANVATGRFMVAANYDPETKTETPVFDEIYPTAVRGISPARVEAQHSTEFLISNAKQMNLIPKETPDDYVAIKDAKQKYDFDVIENYVSHKLYAKHLGTFYHGADKEKFEKHLFADKLPEAGSMERRKWDMLADRYEHFIKTNCPEKIDLMKKHIDGYKPIDFTKENIRQAQRQNSGQTAVRQALAQNGCRT